MSTSIPALSTPTLALLFPGQGSQCLGMGRDLYDHFPSARAVFDEADEALGFPLSKLIFEGPEEDLQLTEHTQPAILTVSTAAARVLLEALVERGLSPAFAAGHSLGEYTAYVAAGTFTFADAVRAVRNRGRYMQEAVPPGEGAMAAILGLSAAQVNDICARASDDLTHPAPADTTDPIAQAFSPNSVVVSPANLNSPDQTVISGATRAVEHAAALCKAAGAKRTVMLKVSAPFHCALMAPAQQQLAIDLEAILFADPAFPIVANVDARLITRDADARDCLVRQVTAPVRWVESIDLLLQQGVTHFIEVGPGKVLSGLLRQIHKAAQQTQAAQQTKPAQQAQPAEQTQPAEPPPQPAAALSLNVEDTVSLEKTLATLSGT